MKRSPLRRGKPLSRGSEGLKRTPFKRPLLPDGDEAHQYSTLPRENKRRKAKARARDFGPHGNTVIPRLPCAVCFPWFYARSDDVLRDVMAEVFAHPDCFAVVSEPAHVTHSRGAGGDRTCLVPKCAPCHALQHSAGAKTFAAAHPGIDLPTLAARLWRLSPARALEEVQG